MKSEFIELEIVKWDAYNPRGDVKRPSWFRLENRLLESADFYSWPGEQIKALIYIFSQASQKNSKSVRIYPDHANRSCMIKERDLREAIDKLLILGVIFVHDTRTLRGRNVDVTQTFATLHNKTERDETEHNTTPEPAASRPPKFDFESVSKIYPNPKGRSEGVARLRKLITNQEDFEKFTRAVGNYSEQCAMDGVEPRFIKHFSSFVGSGKTGHPWQDWVDHTPTAASSGLEASNRAAADAYLKRFEGTA